MNIGGIVCEYNPFHNGHLHHIEQTRKQNIDGIVCVMSGNFVQRGDFAIMHKLARAETAIRCGADVVIELPLPWSIASAERFAYGAVSILHRLGIVSHISFGTENDDISKLSDAAQIIMSESFNQELISEYSSGISYATARERAFAKFDKEASYILQHPNNILAIEYLKALIKIESKIKPVAISRHGAAHDGDTVTNETASASLIRKKIHCNDIFSDFLPKSSHEIYMRELEKGAAPVFIEAADTSILSSLKQFYAKDFLRCSDVSEGLHFRLEEAISKSSTLAEVIERVKTKRYAHSRIRRILLNAFLNVGAENVLHEVPYARLLAFNDTGRNIVKKAKKTTDIPIITRPSSIKNESKKAYDLFTLERRADDIYSLFMKNPISQGSTFTSSPIYVKNKS